MNKKNVIYNSAPKQTKVKIEMKLTLTDATCINEFIHLFNELKKIFFDGIEVKTEYLSYSEPKFSIVHTNLDTLFAELDGEWVENILDNYKEILDRDHENYLKIFIIKDKPDHSWSLSPRID